MSDLISREALKEAINEIWWVNKYDFDKIVELIDNTQPVEADVILQQGIRNGLEHLSVVIRPQGEWIRTGSLGNGNAQYECSNCHYGDEQAESQEVPYCWHCGAKMRKGGAE